MIRSLRLKNFRRYADASVELRAGVNFVEGENNVGKTTLFYAIEYALFGRVDGFRSQTALMRPGTRAMGVELEFVDREQNVWQLQRVHGFPPRARKSLTGHFTLKQMLPDGTSRYVLSSDFNDTEDKLSLELQARTGLTRRLFGVAVHMKQGEIARILEGSPQLDIVLGVTAAVIAEEELRAVALELEKEAATLPVLQESVRRLNDEAGEIARRVSVLAEEQRTLVAATAAVVEAGRGVAARLGRLDPVLAAWRTLAAAIDAEDRESALLAMVRDRLGEVEAADLPEAEAAAAVAKMAAGRTIRATEAGGVDAQLVERETERRGLDTVRGDLAGRIGRRRALLRADGASGQETSGAAPAKCEACGAPIDAAHSAKEIAEWELEQVAADAKARTNDESVSALRARLDAIRGADRDDAIVTTRLVGHIAQLAKERTAVQEREVALARAGETTASALIQSRQALDAVQELPAFQSLVAVPAGAERELRNPLAAAINGARESLAAEKGGLDAQADDLARNLRRVQDDAGAATSRLGALERESAGLAARIMDLAKKATRAERLRRISQGFKALQTKIREEASERLASGTKELHAVLSGLPDEFDSVSIDPAKYSLQVVPKHLGEEVPAWLSEGGGHRLLLGLAYRLAVVRLVGRCPFVLLDEPTYGLDRHRLNALLERITSLGFSEQILLITHQAMGEVNGHRIVASRNGTESRLASGSVAS